MQLLKTVLVSGLLLACAPLRAQSLPDLSAYPKSLEVFISFQTNSTAKTNLVVMTAFGTATAAFRYVVRHDGGEYDYVEVQPMRGCMAERSKKLSAADVERLTRAVKIFPNYDWSPPLGNLLLVSFMRGTNWVTHSYDWSSPPTPVREAFDIIGARHLKRHNPIK